MTEFKLNLKTYLDQTSLKDEGVELKSHRGYPSIPTWNGVNNLQELSVVLVFVLLGRANLEFPRSTISGPSDVVIIQKNIYTKTINGLNASPYLPYYVDWDIWHFVIVPVLDEMRMRVIGEDEFSLKKDKSYTVKYIKQVLWDLYDKIRDRAIEKKLIPEVGSYSNCPR